MINNNLKFMQSREIKPYEFFFLDELPFQELLGSLKNGGESKLSTIGQIKDYDYVNNECTLLLDNSTIKLNLSRIENLFKLQENNFYIIYGVLKVKDLKNKLKTFLFFLVRKRKQCDIRKLLQNCRRKVRLRRF